MGKPTEHPRESLLFYIEGLVQEKHVSLMTRAIAELVESREWTESPPSLIDETQQETERDEDLPVRTVGGLLNLLSAKPPWGQRLARETDRAQYEEVCDVVEKMRQLSRMAGIAVAFELDRTHVGRVVAGEPDRLLRVGLLDPWKHQLEGPS